MDEAVFQEGSSRMLFFSHEDTEDVQALVIQVKAVHRALWLKVGGSVVAFCLHGLLEHFMAMSELW